MKIAIPVETDEAEPRVAATPDTVKRLIGLGADIVVQAGAGLASGIRDNEYEAAGAKLAVTASGTVADADIVLKVRRPTADELADYKKGALVIAIMDPYGNEAALKAHRRGRRRRLRHGADAAHHPRPGDGRAVEPGQPRRLPRGDRRRRRATAAPCR